MAAQITITVGDDGQMQVGGQMGELPPAVVQNLIVKGILAMALEAVASPQAQQGPPGPQLFVANGAIPRFRPPPGR